MKTYKGYLIDLDGTMYNGTEKIEEACEFVRKLKERGIPYLFVTNNSSRTPKQVADKLVSFDIPATEEQVFTTSMATAQHIAQQKQNASVYVIGEEGIRQAIEENGLTFAEEDADFVVVGIDRGITYEKLATGCLAIRNGATFISTNGDVAIPTERGLLPGNGSLTSVLTVSTGVQPVFIGKPESIIMEQAMRVLGTDISETLMIGDNYATDIMAGMNAGMDTLLVHTGVTKREHLADYPDKPTHAVDSLTDWLTHI
ncbi:TIGR01457 family HAD-type hydrolase [Bacillus atrophaeus]|uniref:TIGR01457 family HAD-type hydrolase n=1 Tax=Bacillus atrophaeus TaxID=1452 RepID=UPI00227F8BA6|nr:TIGR01457 family HAD-type hydrolase [Bacillus atrophaeus]MCY8921758.1 TIGR01457 family HAD-type hydrolase [Bacillus atrophaeus]